jgi:hypothetical protein
MKYTVLTFGCIAGGIVSLMIVVMVAFHETIGFDRGEIIGYTSMVVAFLLVYFGVRSYRDNVAGGSLSFGRAFTVGALIAVVASVCYVITWEVIYFNFAPDFAAKYQAHTLEKARAEGASQAAIDKKVADMKKFHQLYQNPAINAAITFIEPLPVGLIIALVSAGILRRRAGGPAATALA